MAVKRICPGCGEERWSEDAEGIWRCVECGAEIPPAVEKLISINILANKCGFFECGKLNNGYGCTNPENTEAPGCCHTFACPVAYEAGYDDMLRLDPDLAEEYRDEHERNGFIESDWMVQP